MQKNQLGLWYVLTSLNNIPSFLAIFLFLGWCYCNFVSNPSYYSPADYGEQAGTFFPLQGLPV